MLTCDIDLFANIISQLTLKGYQAFFVKQFDSSKPMVTYASEQPDYVSVGVYSDYL